MFEMLIGLGVGAIMVSIFWLFWFADDFGMRDWNLWPGDAEKPLADIPLNRGLWPDGAEGPSKNTVATARAILDVLEVEALRPSQVVATSEGGVAICFVEGDKYADIECFNTGTILGVTSDKNQRPIVWQIEPDSRDFTRAADRIRAFLRASPPA